MASRKVFRWEFESRISESELQPLDSLRPKTFRFWPKIGLLVRAVFNIARSSRLVYFILFDSQSIPAKRLASDGECLGRKVAGPAPIYEETLTIPFCASYCNVTAPDLGSLKLPFPVMLEAVHHITDYFDGPVRGVADFDGTPHAFELVFDPDRDDFDRDQNGIGLYWVKPLDRDTMELVFERLEIWKRWSHAHELNQTTIETHPALPEDQPRYAEIVKRLGRKLEIDPTTALKFRGKFSATSLLRVARGLGTEKATVEWFKTDIT